MFADSCAFILLPWSHGYFSTGSVCCSAVIPRNGVQHQVWDIRTLYCSFCDIRTVFTGTVVENLALSNFCFVSDTD